MDQWSGKIAVVTGASSGIGAAIAEELVKHGVITVGLARRKQRIQELADRLKSDGKLYAVKADFSDDKDIIRAFKWIKDNLGGIDILINNAGFFRSDRVLDIENNRHLYQIHVFALQLCTREALNSMKERNIDGHIININSVAGIGSLDMNGSGAWYIAAKHTSTLISDMIRKELANSGLRAKITNIHPSYVDTEIFEEAGSEKPTFDMIKPQEIANLVIYILGMRREILVTSVTVELTDRILL